MKTVVFIVILFTIILGSCSQTILHLSNETSDQQYMVFRLEHVDLFFLKEEVLLQTQLMARRETLEFQKVINEAYIGISNLNEDTLVVPFKLSADLQKRSAIVNAHLLLTLTYHDLLKQGKVKVFNVITESFEDKIYCKRTKQSDVFYFSNGREFYRYIRRVR